MVYHISNEALEAAMRALADDRRVSLKAMHNRTRERLGREARAAINAFLAAEGIEARPGERTE